MQKIKHYLVQSENLFVIIALVFGTAFAFITPLLWGFDEIAHFNRVFQITEGKIIPDKNSEQQAGYIPKNLYELDYLVYGDLMDNTSTDAFSRKDINDSNNYNKLGKSIFSKEYYASPITATYSPIAYVAPVFALLITKIISPNIGEAIHLSRLFSLVFYVFVVWLAIKYQLNKNLKWLLFVTALLPVSIFQASMITADGPAIALSLLFISLLLNTIIGKENKFISKKHLVALGIIAIILPMTKLNYIFLSMGIILIPNRTFVSIRISRAYKSIILALSLLFGSVWTAITQNNQAPASSPRHDGLAVSSIDQINYIASHPFDYALTFVKSVFFNSNTYFSDLFSLIGWNYARLPILVTMVLVILLFIATLNIKSIAPKIKNKIIILNIFIFAGIASIFTVLYIAFTPVGSTNIDGIHGRYFIPFLIPILLLLALVVPIKLEIQKNKSALLFGLTITASLLASVLYYYHITY